MAGKVRDITGQRFGHLVALQLDCVKDEAARWKCKCDCGKFKVVRGSHLLNGTAKSCGHPSHRWNFKPECWLPEYKIWLRMIHRCTNPKNSGYKNYGGRGIKVCERWLKIENFVTDMGTCPPGMSIERIDNNGNYTPANCKWASAAEQVMNRRCSKLTKTELDTIYNTLNRSCYNATNNT